MHSALRTTWFANFSHTRYNWRRDQDFYNELLQFNCNNEQCVGTFGYGDGPQGDSRLVREV